MRSSDVWLGWPYDVFNFSMVGASVVLALRLHPKFEGLQLGELYLTAGSQHLYETHYGLAENVIAMNEWTNIPALDIDDFMTPMNLYNHLRCMADRQPDNTDHTFLKQIIV
jgi:thymidylate synthase